MNAADRKIVLAPGATARVRPGDVVELLLPPELFAYPEPEAMLREARARRAAFNDPNKPTAEELQAASGWLKKPARVIFRKDLRPAKGQ